MRLERNGDIQQGRSNRKLKTSRSSFLNTTKMKQIHPIAAEVCGCRRRQWRSLGEIRLVINGVCDTKGLEEAGG